MFIRILTTWTIYIFLPLMLPTLSQGAAISDNVVNEPKTMWEALVKKCPNLESPVLKKNEILTNNCLNWAEISTTHSFNPTTNPKVQCLVLYEAVLSFCTQMGDSLVKVQDLIPSTAQSININSSICTSQNQLYPVNNTEHNISNLIQKPKDCFLLCLDYSDSGLTDICKYAYYFTTFNVSKFLRDFKTMKDLKHTELNLENMKNSNISFNVVAINKTSQVLKEPINQGPPEDPPKVAVLAPVTKPKETVNDGTNQHKEVQPPARSEEETNQQKPDDVKPPESQTVTKSNKAAPVLSSGKINSAENVNGQPILKQDKKDNVGTIDSPLPEKDIKPAPIDKPVQELDDYNNDDKAQGADGPDQEPEDAEIEQDEDIKPEPAMPDENSEPKITSTRVKPSTVEDEAVNAFNTPDDDMNGDSYFFSYFTVIMCLFIVGYVGYHNRQKVLALILEGKKGRKSGRGRRPNSANYHKLDTNLEEAITSSCAKSASNVIY